MRFGSELLQSQLGFRDHALVAFFLAERDELDIVVELAKETREAGERAVELLPLAHDALRARGESFQKLGASTSRSSAASLSLARSGSKMPPEQGQGLLDVVDDGLGFSAHLFLWFAK